ncbi:hypothetical protein EI94DRAFT_1738705 [Lactarius quietus]|nr:hypothetical protein EI94DRAFT_1738705 [Lactarius quietus]
MTLSKAMHTWPLFRSFSPAAFQTAKSRRSPCAQIWISVDTDETTQARGPSCGQMLRLQHRASTIMHFAHLWRQVPGVLTPA